MPNFTITQEAIGIQRGTIMGSFLKALSTLATLKRGEETIGTRACDNVQDAAATSINVLLGSPNSINGINGRLKSNCALRVSLSTKGRMLSKAVQRKRLVVEIIHSLSKILMFTTALSGRKWVYLGPGKSMITILALMNGTEPITTICAISICNAL
jgi:hypothetical protein